MAVDDGELEAEPVSGPETGPLEDAPDWMLKGGDETPTVAPVQDEAASAAQADIIVSVIDLAHDRIADATGYTGFRLNDKELVLWQKVVRYYIKFLPMGEWGHAIDLVSLAAMELMKVAGYLAAKKRPEPQGPQGGEAR